MLVPDDTSRQASALGEASLTPVKGPIAVVPYDPDWPRSFERERALLEEALAPWLEGGIHQVGSTAVPGLAAKPIVDMVAGVRDFEEARAAYEPLQAAGYVHDPHRPGIAHHFAKAGYGLHLTEPGSDLWRERLTFRDALRANRKLAREYEALKLLLAREHPDDLGAYTSGKRTFVASVLARDGITLGRR
jgi:GrpB-like predicted nucleotidyltransferase (UPF0157 family)